MQLNDVQRLRLNLYIQERELVSLLNQPTTDTRGIQITRDAIDRLKTQIAFASGELVPQTLPQ
jgi:hypothetical protein